MHYVWLALLYFSFASRAAGGVRGSSGTEPEPQNTKPAKVEGRTRKSGAGRLRPSRALVGRPPSRGLISNRPVPHKTTPPQPSSVAAPGRLQQCPGRPCAPRRHDQPKLAAAPPSETPRSLRAKQSLPHKSTPFSKTPATSHGNLKNIFSITSATLAPRPPIHPPGVC